ncbi:hypothetical protein AeNC1_013254 [Aphanomyces euteiches]|nr:hypothetical protein AeNC1_013254 [Aphanomyces euteiches]
MEAQIVVLQRQSRERHALRNTFSKTIASRFFMDGGLERRQRLVESARRRQKRLREKTELEHRKGEWLRRLYEDKKALEDKKRGREIDRATRRVQNQAATCIQAAWRQSYQTRLYWRLLHHAAALIQITMRDFTHRQHSKRFHASKTLQKWWRLLFFRLRHVHAARTICACIVRYTRRRRGQRFRLRWVAALVLQRVWRVYWGATQHAAAAVIQRIVRQKRQKKQMKRLASVYQHLKMIDRMNTSARVLQRHLGLRAVRRRLASDPAFQLAYRQAKQPTSSSLMRFSADPATETRLQEATDREVELTSLKNNLLDQIATLKSHSIPKATKEREDERESLRRMRALEAQRVEKEKLDEMERVRSFEQQTRREIRMEMEKIFDQARRDKMKAAKAPAARGDLADSRVEVDRRVG